MHCSLCWDARLENIGSLLLNNYIRAAEERQQEGGAAPPSISLCSFLSAQEGFRTAVFLLHCGFTSQHASAHGDMSVPFSLDNLTVCDLDFLPCYRDSWPDATAPLGTLSHSSFRTSFSSLLSQEISRQLLNVGRDVWVNVSLTQDMNMTVQRGRESDAELIPEGEILLLPPAQRGQRSELAVNLEVARSSVSRSLLQGGHMHVVKVEPFTLDVSVAEPCSNNKVNRSEESSP